MDICIIYINFNSLYNPILYLFKSV